MDMPSVKRLSGVKKLKTKKRGGNASVKVAPSVSKMSEVMRACGQAKKTRFDQGRFRNSVSHEFAGVYYELRALKREGKEVKAALGKQI